ncbi:GNAT family N-acetyltransferase [Thermodesulfobacteriota bacterium]
MQSIIYIEEKPSAPEYNNIRRGAGWGEFPDIQGIEKGLDNTLFNLCVRKNGELIGFGRVIGDGTITFYIQDVIVIKKYQQTGIGKEIMQRLMAYISSVASEGAIIGLLSAKGKEAFYKNFGFISRPNEKYGKGMFMYWRNKDAF